MDAWTIEVAPAPEHQPLQPTASVRHHRDEVRRVGVEMRLDPIGCADRVEDHVSSQLRHLVAPSLSEVDGVVVCVGVGSGDYVDRYTID